MTRPILKARKRSGDAAHHITEESERLFCETLRAVFLVEKNGSLENSLVMDVRNSTRKSATSAGGGVEIPQRQQHTILKHDLPTPSPSPDERRYPHLNRLVREYVEVWDYAGGARFRGFVAEKDGERALFVFFDKEVIGKDLKPGVVALLELADNSLDCSQLVVCVDRTADNDDTEDITRDLGWVGFELMMLDAWAGQAGCISDRWLFLGMEV